MTGTRFYIACLFTSHGYGQKVSPPANILANTASALRSFKDELRSLNQDLAAKHMPLTGEVWTVRMNSDLFKVKWEDTKAVLEESGIDMVVRYMPQKAAQH